MQRYPEQHHPGAITPVNKQAARFSAPSILALLSAIASLFVTAGWGILLAIAALGFGAVGVLMALSPRVRGGVVSILAMFAAGIGVIVAIVRLIL